MLDTSATPLRIYREDVRCETLDEVAARARGITKMTLSLIERGRHKPRKTNHKILARAYRVSLKKFRSMIAAASN